MRPRLGPLLSTLLLVLGGAVLCLALAACAAAPPPLPPAPPLPTPSIQPISFPRDDGAHAMLTEWWYYTGHLLAPDGARYGFELVTFQALRGQNPPVYVSHFAITDHQRRAFAFDQHAEPAGQSVAAADGFNLDVGGWTMRGANGLDQLAAAMPGYAIQLVTHALKPPVLHEGDGYISFGPAGDSYYYSRTRLEVSGTVADHDLQRPVEGEAWFDHQWGNFLVVGAGGWDWFSAQLDDGSDLTLSLVRDDRGHVPLAYGTYVDREGRATHLPPERFQVEATGSWTSPHSGAPYPMGWHVVLKDPSLDLTLTPVLQDQELDTGRTTGATYWEGEVTIAGTAAGVPVAGRGYVELTGYAH